MIMHFEVKFLLRGFLAVLGGFCLTFSIANADESAAEKSAAVKIAGVIIPGLFDTEDRGPYNEIYDLITADFPQPIDLKVLPIRRARRAFFSGKSDCIFVGSLSSRVYVERGIAEEELVFSVSINSIAMMAYTRPSDPVIASAEDLKDKLIALDAGAGSVDVFKPMFLPKATEAIQTNTPAQAFALLEQGRVDVAMAFDYDVSLLIKRDPSIANFKFAADYSIVSNEDVMVCRRNSQVEALLSHVNSKLEVLRASGRLSEITGN